MSIEQLAAQRNAAWMNTLESMIDGSSVTHVLDLLVMVCHEKAAHLQENWQDEQSATAWTRAAKIIDRQIGKIDV